jgi:hypothetical protein
VTEKNRVFRRTIHADIHTGVIGVFADFIDARMPGLHLQATSIGTAPRCRQENTGLRMEEGCCSFTPLYCTATCRLDRRNNNTEIKVVTTVYVHGKVTVNKKGK